MTRALVMALVLAAAASCASWRGDGSIERAALAPGLVMTLPRPVGLERSVRASQLVTLRRGDQAFTFQGHIEAGPARFTLVGLDMLGRRAMTIRWTDDALSAEAAPWLPDGFDVRNMLADIVVIYWPEAVVRQTLRDAGGVLDVGPHRRVVTFDDREVVRIDYTPSAAAPWSGKTHYVNSAWGYAVEIQSVEAAP